MPAEPAVCIPLPPGYGYKKTIKTKDLLPVGNTQLVNKRNQVGQDEYTLMVVREGFHMSGIPDNDKSIKTINRSDLNRCRRQ